MIMYVTFWIANETVPWITELGIQNETIEESHCVAAVQHSQREGQKIEQDTSYL